MHAPHRHHDDPATLAPLAEYRRALLNRLQPLEPIELTLREAHGCVLAEDVTAAEDVPAFANSAMDGYAVIAEGLAAGSDLVMVGEVAAGAAAPPRVGGGQAVRIMTGAPIPPGADAIVPVEVVEERAGSVVLRVAPLPGEHVRPAGESVTAGQHVLSSGRRLGPAEIGMLASVGRERVRVHPGPRVAVVATGDELVPPGAPLRPGQVRDSNSFALAALAREAGAEAFRVTQVGDRSAELEEAFEGALAQADLLVSSGGVSAGRYDLVKRVLAQMGDVTFRKVAMKPGMPQAFGFVRGVPAFGLPGNPVSAYVSFEVFVRPAIRRLQGRTDLNRRRIEATVTESFESVAHKTEFVRVRLKRGSQGWEARSTGPQGSGVFRSLIEADGLAEVPAETTSVAAGQRVTVHLLRDELAGAS
ncbi:MAG: molybdopterin molybdotransferase MoeA [Egibacteraceae bacterium]